MGRKESDLTKRPYLAFSLFAILQDDGHRTPYVFIAGVVLGSFYYGYIGLQIVGGWLALKIGATRLYGLSLFISSLLTLLTPIATRASVYLLITLRIIEGLVLVRKTHNHQSIKVTYE